MITVRESGKGKLLEYDGVQFWIQKRWQRADGQLTPAGKQAMARAMGEHRRHWDFNACRVFTVVRETGQAVLVRCPVTAAETDLPGQKQEAAEFWIPRSMIRNYGYVRGKVRELERNLPFGGKLVWGKAGS
jgi:hypothetical protein